MLNANQIKLFADFIQKEIGIVYSEQIHYQLDQRLTKVAEYLGLKDTQELYDLAFKKGITGDFRAYLLDIATNNETSFFRDVNMYNAIEKFILPQLRVDYPQAFNYRIWSAASSFGQEPYSLAMLVNETRQKDPKFPTVAIKATDISEQALSRCREGKYSQLEVQRGLAAPRLIKYFSKTEDQNWQIKPEIKALVDFSRQNLLDSFAGLGKFHIVFCRYVLIYQATEKKKEIFARLVSTLQPRGFLILGGSESALGLSDDLEQVEASGAVFYRKKTGID